MVQTSLDLPLSSEVIYCMSQLGKMLVPTALVQDIGDANKGLTNGPL